MSYPRTLGVRSSGTRVTDMKDGSQIHRSAAEQPQLGYQVARMIWVALAFWVIAVLAAVHIIFFAPSGPCLVVDVCVLAGSVIGAVRWYWTL